MSTLITFITIIHIIQSYIDCVNIHITSNSHDTKEDMEDIAAGGGQGESALTQGRGAALAYRLDCRRRRDSDCAILYYI